MESSERFGKYENRLYDYDVGLLSTVVSVNPTEIRDS